MPGDFRCDFRTDMGLRQMKPLLRKHLRAQKVLTTPRTACQLRSLRLIPICLPNERNEFYAEHDEWQAFMVNLPNAKHLKELR